MRQYITIAFVITLSNERNTGMYYLAETENIQETLDLDNGYTLEGLCDITCCITGTKPYSLDEAIKLLKEHGYTVMG